MALVNPVTETSTADAATPRRPGWGWWGSDFRFARGRVQVLDTGADLVLDWVLAREALVWLGYHLIVRLRSWWMALARPDAPRLWFSPVAPRPWYWIWSAMAWSGMRLAPTPQDADARFAFEDTTWSAGPAGAFNARCIDVSKSHVARVFEQVAGYPLALDPQVWRGPAVEKGELNGAHDGRIVSCPTPPLPGRCHQRLIDTCDGDFTYDLRTSCVGGRAVAVWIKRKPKEGRFSIHNLGVTLHEPGEVFSSDELDLIGRFLGAMGADWAGLDILRDRADGRIYIVDVNKTDVGPIIALPLADKLRSTAMLSRALEAMLKR